jgi:hypothetical protein
LSKILFRILIGVSTCVAEKEPLYKPKLGWAPAAAVPIMVIELKKALRVYATAEFDVHFRPGKFAQPSISDYAVHATIFILSFFVLRFVKERP